MLLLSKIRVLEEADFKSVSFLYIHAEIILFFQKLCLLCDKQSIIIDRKTCITVNFI